MQSEGDEQKNKQIFIASELLQIVNLDSGLVLSERMPRRGGCVTLPDLSRPDVEEVIITTAGEVTAIWWPLESADLLRVTSEWTDEMLGYSHIVMVDTTTSRTTTTDKIILAKIISS